MWYLTRPYYNREALNGMFVNWNAEFLIYQQGTWTSTALLVILTEKKKNCIKLKYWKKKESDKKSLLWGLFHHILPTFTIKIAISVSQVPGFMRLPFPRQTKCTVNFCHITLKCVQCFSGLIKMYAFYATLGVFKLYMCGDRNLRW